MPFKFDPKRIIAILQDQGYDAYRDDGGVAGRLEQGAPRLIWIQPDGALRFQVTRLVAEATTTHLTRQGRDYRLSAERHEIVTIWTRLDTVAALTTVLADLETLATMPRSQAPADLPPPIHEASTDDAPPLAAEIRSDDTPATPPMLMASRPKKHKGPS